MKKAILALSLLLVIGIGFSSISLPISGIEISSIEIYPGGSGTISFTITNTENTDLTNVRAMASSQLEIYPSIINIGTIKPGESKFLIFTYSASSSMPSASYAINIEAKFDKGGQQLSSQSGMPIKVLSSNELAINNYTSTLMIDSENDFNISISNFGNDIMKNIFINMELPSGFIPIEGSEFYIEYLNPWESREIGSKIFIQKEIEPESYQFGIQLKSNDYSSLRAINLMAIGEPKIVINSINLDPKMILSNNRQIISSQIENIGSAKAYAIKAELLAEQEFDGITLELLGSLDREDITSAIFEIIVPSGIESLQGQILITYSDEKGNEFSAIESINYKIFEQDGSGIYLAIIIAIIAAAGFFAYKKLKKKK